VNTRKILRLVRIEFQDTKTLVHSAVGGKSSNEERLPGISDQKFLVIQKVITARGVRLVGGTDREVGEQGDAVRIFHESEKSNIISCHVYEVFEARLPITIVENTSVSRELQGGVPFHSICVCCTFPDDLRS